MPIDIFSNDHLIDEAFGNCLKKASYEEMGDWSVHALLNKNVSKISAEIIKKLPGEYKIYQNYDSVKGQTEGAV